MSSVNQAIIVGRVGKDPEIRYLPNGDAVANLSVATSETWKDKNGDKQEATEWHRISVFGKLAEICGEYLRKGSLVYFSGQIKTRKWADKDGVEKYTTEINAREMKMLGGKPDGGEQQRPAQRQQPAQRPAAKQPSTSFDDFDSDIPF